MMIIYNNELTYPSQIGIHRSGSIVVDFDVHLTLLLADAEDMSKVEEYFKKSFEEAIAPSVEREQLGRFSVIPDSFAVSSGNVD